MVKTSIHPITLEVNGHAFIAAADEMKINLMRTAYNPIIYEVLDFSCGVFDRHCRMIAQADGLPIFLGNLAAAVRCVVEDVGEDNLRRGENFIGRVRMQNFANAGRDDELESLAVFFDGGSRTRPHSHPTDQLLYFVSGSRFVVFPGEDEQRIPEGGLVVVPATLVHMHGATDEEPVCHLAIRCPGRTDWHPPVPDEWRQFVS